MALTSFDAYIARAAAIGNDVQPIYGQIQSATSTSLLAASTSVWQRVAYTRAVPNPLPSGVTAYNPVMLSLTSSVTSAFTCVKQVNLGTITFGNSTATFSAGSSMPTVTQGNTASVQTSGMMMAEVTTALSATPGSITVNYNNQAGSAKSTASTAITASAVVGTCSPWILAAGDWGVQSVTSITPSGVGASQSGVITLWGLLPIGSGTSVGSAVAGTSGVRNFLTSSLPPAHLVAGDQIGIFTAISTARAVQGTLTYVGAS